MSSKARLIHSLFITVFMSGLFLELMITQSVAQGNITSPEENFGFQMGADRKMARWDKIVDYFKLLETESDRIKGYYGGNMDEGWTRMVLEQFAFPYTSLMDAEILKGELEETYDVIVLPSNDPCMITGDTPKEYMQGVGTEYPKKYLSGIKKEGVENLKTFVNNGGTLVALADATEFAIDTFELKVQNVIENVSSGMEFFCPGSTLKAHFTNNDPLAYGMPEEGLVLFRSSPTFRIKSGRHNDQYKTIVRYVDKNVLQSGWLIGETRIAKKAGMIEAKVGNGRVILIGFRTQHRCQTHGTFKLLFNTMIW